MQPHGALFPGNPTEGALLFDTHPSDATQPCAACHQHPFGAAGGALGGVEPAEPTSSSASALFNGDADGSPHSDLEIPHMRNMHEKFGPVHADPGDNSMPSTVSGFGYSSGPFFGEILLVATDGSQRVNRLARHRSSYRSYFDSPRANISRDGRFVVFNSNWGSRTRRDIFILKVPQDPK